MTDWRAVLLRYMSHIAVWEGIHFLEHGNGDVIGLTEEELDALLADYKEADV